MGNGDSKCSSLLDRLRWPKPELADEFNSGTLIDYLANQNFELVLPRHAPQCDLSIGDKKAAMYPRPNFCWEGCKMHLALIGPSTACKNQITQFLPKMANVFQGPPSRMGPGREAKPHYFFDPDLNRMVLWELPEINFKQSCEDYVRELGLLYIDCVFLLFSDKYVVTDVYSKLCVTMALHGIPFFVICTMSGDELDEKAWNKLKTDFQKKDIQARMFNPNKPQDFLNTTLSDFVSEVQWNRSKKDEDLAKGVAEHVLGQTVRIKNIEKKPELNGKCGVCLGFDNEQARYRVRVVLNGVETDLALKETCITVLKPKLVKQMVRVTGLEGRPELNGSYGFVDEFLRENERYRVFLPGASPNVQTVALKGANLEAVSSWSDAMPAKERASPAAPSAKAAQPATAKAAPAAKRPAAKGKSKAKAAGIATAAPKAAAAGPGPPEASNPGGWRGPRTASGSPDAAGPHDAKAAGAVGPDRQAKEKPAWREATVHEEPLADSVARGGDDDGSGTDADDPKARLMSLQSRPEEHRRMWRLSLTGALSRRVWAVVGDGEQSSADLAEEILDHLMDCGKTVFGVGVDAGGHFATIGDITKEAGIETVAFVKGTEQQVSGSLQSLVDLGVRGVLVHSEGTELDEKVSASFRKAGIGIFSVDIIEEVQPLDGLLVAPID